MIVVTKKKDERKAKLGSQNDVPFVHVSIPEDLTAEPVPTHLVETNK